MTPWNRDRWILRVLHTDFKWRVELNQLLSRDEDVVSTCVRVPMPDYDPDSADLGELEQWATQGQVKSLRVSAWDRLLEDDPCPTE